MEPITTLCEECNGDRYSKEALQYSYKNKSIVEVLNMSVEDACEFFNDNKKIMSYLNALMEVGLPYISLGQPLSTFSGGERQRVKLAENIKKKGNNVSIKLYSIYAPPQHPKGTIHRTKADAEH